MDRRERKAYEVELRHRINAGRVAVLEQTGFFKRQFGDVSSEWKADDTRVTFADFAISEKMFRELGSQFSKDDFCSEEGSPSDEILQLDAPFAWVVDPIDGTNNYALGNRNCAIALGLLYEGTPVYGFVYDHSRECLWEGGPGFGLNCDRTRVNREKATLDAQPMVGLHFPMPDKLLAQLGPLMSQYRVRSFGSAALSTAYLASGYFFGVVDQKVKVWDVAASYALCRAVDIDWRFIERPLFPLTHFHVDMEACPFVAGTEAFMDQFAAIGDIV